MIRAEVGRIAGNFLRLFIGFLLGIIVVRGVLGFGTEVFNIYVLVTVGAGVAIMLRELIRRVIVPLFGQHYQLDDDAFARAYANGWWVCIAAALFGSVLLAVMALYIDRFSVDPGHVAAARWFIAGRIVMLIIGVVTLPLLSMLLVRHDFQRSNTILVFERLADVIGVVVPVLVLGADARGDRALLWMTAASVASFAAIYIIYAWRTFRLDPRFRPRWGLIDTATLRIIGAGLVWSAIIVVSFNAYFRFDALFINLHLGQVETAAFGIAVQLAGIMRQLTTGLVSGLDAVVVRMLRPGADATRPAQASDPDATGRKIGKLTQISLRLQAVMTAGSLALVAVALDPILRLWLGGALRDERVYAAAGTIIFLVMAGLGARSLTEGFMQALNARNAMRRYAVWLLPIAIANPIILLMIAGIARSSISLELVGWSYVVGMALFGLIVVPLAMRREYGTPLAGMLWAAAPPFLAAFAGSLLYMWLLPHASLTGNAARLLVAAACIGVPLALDSILYLRLMARKNRR